MAEHTRSTRGAHEALGVFWHASLGIAVSIIVLTCAALAAAGALDVLTDVLVLLITVFFHFGICAAYVVLSVLPTVNFARMLVRLDASPKRRILTPPASLYPFATEVRVTDLNTAVFDLAGISLSVLKRSPRLLVNSGNGCDNR